MAVHDLSDRPESAQVQHPAASPPIHSAYGYPCFSYFMNEDKNGRATLVVAYIGASVRSLRLLS
jgi:hypothetical protein